MGVMSSVHKGYKDDSRGKNKPKYIDAGRLSSQNPHSAAYILIPAILLCLARGFSPGVYMQAVAAPCTGQS